MNKCFFLDRDGVLNVERGDYTFLPKDFEIIEGVSEAVEKIKRAGYLAIVVTNQAGITKGKGLFTREQMQTCHDILMDKTHNLIDHVYYSPYHPTFSASLTRKPDSLMLEKAMSKYDIDPSFSWLIGDRCGDILCGQKMGMETVFISGLNECECQPTFKAKNLLEAVNRII